MLQYVEIEKKEYKQKLKGFVRIFIMLLLLLLLLSQEKE